MLIKNAHVLSPHVTEGFYDIRVLDGKIAEVGRAFRQKVNPFGMLAGPM
ncbi:MAG: hypothetical protein ACLVLA_12975 [Acidaminococcus intestini]